MADSSPTTLSSLDRFNAVQDSPCSEGGAYDWVNEERGPEPEDGWDTLCLKCFEYWFDVDAEMFPTDLPASSS